MATWHQSRRPINPQHAILWCVYHNPFREFASGALYSCETLARKALEDMPADRRKDCLLYPPRFDVTRLSSQEWHATVNACHMITIWKACDEQGCKLYQVYTAPGFDCGYHVSSHKTRGAAIAAAKREFPHFAIWYQHGEQWRQAQAETPHNPCRPV